MTSGAVIAVAMTLDELCMHEVGGLSVKERHVDIV